MNNTTNQGIQHITLNDSGDLNITQSRNKMENNQSNIDKSKKYTLNVENMIMAWANPYNTEAVLYKRLPNVNDRPMLEHYYKIFELKDDNFVSYKITTPMTFYAYVVTKRSKLNYAVINLIDEYGTKMAAHSIIKGCDLSKYLNKIIKFTGELFIHMMKIKKMVRLNMVLPYYKIKK